MAALPRGLAVSPYPCLPRISFDGAWEQSLKKPAAEPRSVDVGTVCIHFL